jgi:hypothetical protein
VWWDPEQPLLYLEGILPAEQGAAVQTALERRAERVVLADAPESPREARMADALVELVTGSARGEAPVPTVVVHAGAEVLAGEEPPRAPGWPRPKGATAFPPRRSVAWPATPGSNGSWSGVAGPRGWGGGAGGSPARSSGSSATETGGAGSPGASGAGGSTPTTWSTGPGAEGPPWTTWSFCAGPTTGWCTRAGGGSLATRPRSPVP